MKKILKKILGAGEANEISRENWLEASLKKIPAGTKILDAGAGSCRYKKFCGHLEYTSQDFGGYDGKGDGQGLQTIEWSEPVDITCDIVKIPVEDSAFGAVMCVEVFEHIPSPIEAIKEFARILQTNGTLVLSAPFCSGTHFAPFHFYSGFNHYFHEKHLVENGFEILAILPNGNYFDYLIQEISRLPYMSKRYTAKSFRPFAYLLSFLLVLCLKMISKQDKGSSEFMNFGYHVIAKKIS